MFSICHFWVMAQASGWSGGERTAPDEESRREGAPRKSPPSLLCWPEPKQAKCFYSRAKTIFGAAKMERIRFTFTHIIQRTATIRRSAVSRSTDRMARLALDCARFVDQHNKQWFFYRATIDCFGNIKRSKIFLGWLQMLRGLSVSLSLSGPRLALALPL